MKLIANPKPLNRKLDRVETAIACLQTYLDDPKDERADLYPCDALEFIRQALSCGTQTTVLKGLRRK